MNASPEQYDMMKATLSPMPMYLSMALGCEVETIMANCTKQVKDYSRYEFSDATAQAHDKWHEEHFAEELQRAFEAGKRMAEYALRVANV